MLHIRYGSQGKVEYAMGLKTDVEHQDNQNASNVILTPRVQNDRSKKKMDVWYHDNINHVTQIIQTYIHSLHEFCSLNPQYVCSLKEHEINKLFIHMLYDCSHSSFKNYPSL